MAFTATTPNPGLSPFRQDDQDLSVDRVISFEPRQVLASFAM
jgi:hypothetical protein